MNDRRGRRDPRGAPGRKGCVEWIPSTWTKDQKGDPSPPAWVMSIGCRRDRRSPRWVRKRHQLGPGQSLRRRGTRSKTCRHSAERMGPVVTRLAASRDRSSTPRSAHVMTLAGTEGNCSVGRMFPGPGCHRPVHMPAGLRPRARQRLRTWRPEPSSPPGPHGCLRATSVGRSEHQPPRSTLTSATPSSVSPSHVLQHGASNAPAGNPRSGAA
jgi:hypothetical protein